MASNAQDCINNCRRSKTAKRAIIASNVSENYVQLAIFDNINRCLYSKNINWFCLLLYFSLEFEF